MAFSSILEEDFKKMFSSEFLLDEFAIKRFVVYLYHTNSLNEKEVFSITKEKFLSKLKLWKDDQDLCCTPKFDNIVKECKLSTESVDNDELIIINKQTLLEYENDFLNELDQRQVKETLLKHTLKFSNDDIKIIFNPQKEKLEFKTCVLVKETLRNENSSILCEICCLDFSCDKLFEEHLEMHTSTSNFEWVKINGGSPFPRFQIFYQISEDSNFIKFSLHTQYSGITLNSVLTARSTDTPLLVNHRCCEKEIEEGGYYKFTVDKHIFIKSIEQPIYVIFHMFANIEQSQQQKFAELHTISPNVILPRKSLSGDAVRPTELKTKKGIISPYFPRDSLKELYSSGENFDENDLLSISEAFRKFRTEDGRKLTPSNFSEVFKILLEMEDIETEKFYLNFIQKEVSIKYVRKSEIGFEYLIKLTNLPDGEIFHSTINCGDELILICNDMTTTEEILNVKPVRKGKSKYFGIISNIYGTTVYFECRKEKVNINKKYDIKFRPNRRNFVYQYSALDAIDKYSLISVYLFPEDKPFESSASVSELDIFDVNVKTNPEQKEAVMNVVDGIKNFLPYIIVGPPGTGKTTTIVECILQLQIKNPEKKILVTAGSNAACNEIAKRLVKAVNSKFHNVKMLRLYSKSAEKYFENIDKNLIAASNLLNGYHFYPSIESINKYNVVICTTSLVGRLKSSGLQQTNFSYCFIDECAASTEPEILVAIEAVFHSNINIIIAGDPKQLGPILQSQRASEYGLKKSLLERLLHCKCYRVNDDKSYNKRIQTRLIRNFRTHSDILAISNKLFYSNSLMACAKSDLTHWAVGWDQLPEKNLPLVFHHVSGHTKKDMYSTSLFNPEEINVVMDYVRRLMYFPINNKKIKEEDIGVISPYKKQSTIIREELDKRNWYKIATGSVETFQGQEKPIIIVSTVRSEFSDRVGVGFLINEKRLNVMLTRAQALLIVIGNAEYLSSIPNWKESIKYCKDKNVLIKTENKN